MLSVSPNGRYLLNDKGNPVFLGGDSGWAAFNQLMSDDSDFYLDTIQGLGFNAVLFEAIEHMFCNNAPNNAYNEFPFTGTAFQSDLNPAFWNRLRNRIRAMRRRGMYAVIDFAYTGFEGSGEGWSTEMLAAGDVNCGLYGTRVGNFLRGEPNIIYVTNGDTNLDNATLKGYVNTMTAALHAADPTKLISSHNARSTLGSDIWAGPPSWFGINNTYANTTNQLSLCVSAWNYSPTLPYGLLEARYENDSAGLSEAQLRGQIWRPFLTGAKAFNFMGNCPRWFFSATSGSSFCTATPWVDTLDSVTTLSMSRFMRFWFGATARQWWNLVPDFDSVFMTSGRGTPDTLDYAACAMTEDMSMACAYVPTDREVTFNMSRFSPSGPLVQVTQVRGSDGAETVLGTYPARGSQSFDPPASGDWIYYLEQVKTPNVLNVLNAGV